jgi:hypothetical protein
MRLVYVHACMYACMYVSQTASIQQVDKTGQDTVENLDKVTWDLAYVHMYVCVKFCLLVFVNRLIHQ